MSLTSKKRVVVGMSGGVDSSVAAYLLLQQGYDVAGVFMKNWEEDDTDTYCSATQDRNDAQAVCDTLGITLHTINFASEYWDHVFTHFLDTLKTGQTPNPDILCNKEIKFKAFFDFAQTLGAEFIATGHYARTESINNHVVLKKAVDLNKDQSYFLHAVKEDKLARTLFPLGLLTKPEVRELAKTLGFINHAKKDSTGICFIGERKFKAFLADYLPAKPGDIINTQGEIIGRHEGVMYYTIGQRQGLGIGGLAQGDGHAWYVAQKDMEKNTLLVVQGRDHPLLYEQSLMTDSIEWINTPEPQLPLSCTAKTRYRQTDNPCILTRVGTQYCVTFSEPQWAITPGQSVVFYQGEVCLGGGVIHVQSYDR